ncbi:MAG TPA: NADH-quinone oxidoreductase subunit J [Gemmata sp.]|nr:NADH-quinone oxidoreductase subunit J [Gemmata sp.]
MTLFSLTPTQNAAGQIGLAAVLAVVGFALLLPNPKGRRVREGVAALLGSVAVFGAWLYSAYGRPMPDLVGTVLFGLFSAGALGFGTVLVVQKNPARGAIAFAFVILSTCGLFLLLAAPFLVAATIIIYAGAIIVTFLFVLMLSHQDGPSDENDRSREPWLGGLAGFAFTGLVLFTLFLSHEAAAPAEAGDQPRAGQRLPAVVLTDAERQRLTEALAKLDATDDELAGDLTKHREDRIAHFASVRDAVAEVVGSEGAAPGPRYGTLPTRLEKTPALDGKPAVLYREDAQARATLARAAAVRDLNGRAFDTLQNTLLAKNPDAAAAKADYAKLRDEVLLLTGAGQLPARNVGNLGYLLYTDHLLAVELAGTLLLVATIGAIAIAQRKRESAE